MIEAINWIIANRQTYHIVIASMSLGFPIEVVSVDSAVSNMVESGITTVISAGNSGSGSNNIYTPGSVDEAITVAATNQFDDITDYSSQGGISRYAGNTIKPDVAAPGEAFSLCHFSAQIRTTMRLKARGPSSIGMILLLCRARPCQLR